jgi:hypothetical protein
MQAELLEMRLVDVQEIGPPADHFIMQIAEDSGGCVVALDDQSGRGIDQEYSIIERSKDRLRPVE